MDEVPVLIDEEDGSKLIVDDRYRVKGGTVVHQAAVSDGEDGVFVVILCDKDIVRWTRHSEENRLDLKQPDDADVTCQTCQGILESLNE